MIRFVLGFVLGALVVAGLQLQFAVLPTADREPSDARAPARNDRDDAPLPALRPSTDSQSANAARRPSVVARDGTVGAAAGANAERETSPTSSEDAGPRFPIELPETHAGFVDKNVPSLPDEHAKVEAEEVDSAWAELVEAEIYSYVSSHPSGSSIQLVSLVCRTTRCEIAGSVFGERGGETWNQVLSDMRKQPWFASNFADSMFGSGGGMPGEFRFITIIARVGSEIAGPVGR